MIRMRVTSATLLFILLLSPSIAAAEVIALSCEVPWGHSGKVMHRLVELDSEGRHVTDNGLTWQDKERHYALRDIAAFVRPGPSVWEWGSVNVETGAEASRFQLDLRTGAYDHYALGLPLLHGACTLAGAGA